MSEDRNLEADIARVAAARARHGKGGHNSIDYRAEAARVDRESRRIHSSEVEAVFIMGPDTELDLWVFDQLPPASRRALREAPIQINAPRYKMLLQRMRDEEALIEAAHDVLPGVARDRTLATYGKKHPAVAEAA